MRCLKRNKRTLYVCNGYQDGNIKKYTEPTELNLNYQATNSDGDLIALGENFPMFVRIKADIQYANYFKAGDRVYINSIPDFETFDVLCKDADYEVTSDPLISLNSVEVNLKKLSGKR